MIALIRSILSIVLLMPTLLPADELCKWVDKNGVVHYARSCPQGVEGEAIHTPTPPTNEEIEEAFRRSQEILEARKARTEQRELSRQAEFVGREQERIASDTQNRLCEDAFRARAILAIDLPVYFDDANRLQHRDSLSFHWYAGEHRYLDDARRQAESDRLAQLIGAQCAGLKPARSSYIYRFRLPPRMHELITMLRNPDSPSTPPQEDVCGFARNFHREMESMRSGLPSDDEREFSRLISEFCP